MEVPAAAPYLAELKKVLSQDPAVLKEYALATILRRNKEKCLKGGQFENKFCYTNDKGEYVVSKCWGSTTSCVFGVFEADYWLKLEGPLKDNVSRLKFNPPTRYGGFRAKCGIEVLGAQPNATGHTYSNKCVITIPRLKEACKKNGIKTTKMDKKAMLHALLKI